MDVVRDLLDEQVVDRNGRDMGRVDSVVLEVGDGRAPRVVAIEIGAAVLAARVRPIFGRWMAALEVACGVGDGTAVRIAFEDVIAVADHVKVDRSVGESGTATIEQRLRALLSRLPGSS
jgi:sporulation protein YlmC with PRC-barrel domain